MGPSVRVILFKCYSGVCTHANGWSEECFYLLLNPLQLFLQVPQLLSAVQQLLTFLFSATHTHTEFVSIP